MRQVLAVERVVELVSDDAVSSAVSNNELAQSYVTSHSFSTRAFLSIHLCDI